MELGLNAIITLLRLIWLYPNGLTSQGWCVKRGLSSNKNLKLRLVDYYPELTEVWDWDELAKNPTLDHHFVMKYHWRLDWDILTKNPSLPLQTIREFSNELTSQQWSNVSRWAALDDDFASEFKDRLDWGNVQHNPNITLDITVPHPTLAKTYSYLGLNLHEAIVATDKVCRRNKITLEMIRFLEDRMAAIDWYIVSNNPNITVDIIDHYTERLDWFCLRRHLTRDLIERYSNWFVPGSVYPEYTVESIMERASTGEIDWESVSRHSILGDHTELILKCEDYLDWDLVSANSHIPYKFIVDNPNLPWNPEILSQRSYQDVKVTITLDQIDSVIRSRHRPLQVFDPSNFIRPKPRTRQQIEEEDEIKRILADAERKKLERQRALAELERKRAARHAAEAERKKLEQRRLRAELERNQAAGRAAEQVEVERMRRHREKRRLKSERIRAQINAELKRKELEEERLRLLIAENDRIKSSYRQALALEKEASDNYFSKLEELEKQISTSVMELHPINKNLKQAKRNNDPILLRTSEVELLTRRLQIARIQVQIQKLELAEAKRLSTSLPSDQLRDSLYKIKLDMEPNNSERIESEREADWVIINERIQVNLAKLPQIKAQLEDELTKASQLQLELHQHISTSEVEPEVAKESTKKSRHVKNRRVRRR